MAGATRRERDPKAGEKSTAKPRRPMAMCRSCGHFVAAVERNGELRPVQSACPECGDDEFESVFGD